MGDPKPIQKYYHDASDFDMVSWMHFFIVPSTQKGTPFKLVSQIKLQLLLADSLLKTDNGMLEKITEAVSAAKMKSLHLMISVHF